MNKPAGSRRSLAHSPFANRVEEPIEVYAVSDRVSHDRYGLGRVSSVDQAAGLVIVDFGSERVRVKSPFTRMVKL